ncbi:MAG: hypothetical protein ACYSTL_03825 [Planctomycetota bacterium]|jgi:hypothetical protein
MKRKNLMYCWMLPVVLAVVASGCTRAIKEGVGVARGAKGLYAPIQMVSAEKAVRPLGEYTRFELGEITDDFGGKVPPNLLMYLRSEFANQLAEKKLPNYPAGKTLLIRGKILHYEDASMLGHALSPLEEVVARIELVDKGSERIIGVANCIGRTTESVNAGVAKKGEGLAKAIVSWIDERYPSEGRLE